jgi:hypothetical protein
MNVFDKFRRSRAWRALFMAPSGELLPPAEIALKELSKFCAADATTMVLDKNGAVDAVGTAMAEGRRQVWLMIQARLHLSEQTISRLREQELRAEANGDG